MIICDLCNDVGKPAFQCHAEIFKEECRKGKDVKRSVKKFPIHLCESCITTFIKGVGNFMNTIQKS